MDTMRSDEELISDVRDGIEVTESFGALYVRHQPAARWHAYQLSRSNDDADDLVASAFIRLFEAMIKGGGPDGSFRAYLFAAIRHQAYDRTRNESRVKVTEDITEVVDSSAIMIPFVDPVVADFERSHAAKAYASLPERWQAVLWYMEIEGKTSAEVAPLFNLSSNAVSTLGFRAREGLRNAYFGLQHG